MEALHNNVVYTLTLVTAITQQENRKLQHKTHLRMVRSGEMMVDAQSHHELIVEFIPELTTLIRCQHLGQTHLHEDPRKDFVIILYKLCV